MRKPAAVPSSVEAATATAITRDTIQRLVESRVLDDGIGESCRDNTTTSADTEETKIKGDDSNINATTDTRTLSGWCLVDALYHCANASDGILAPLILEHGPPSFYLDHLRKETAATKKTSPRITFDEDYPSFLSLCRTVAGQQLAGAAAETIWRRLVGVVSGTTAETEAAGVSALSTPSLQAFTPKALLAVVEKKGMERLRKPAGLSNAKCNCIVAIARCFEAGTLSEAFLMPDYDTIDNTEEVRSRLLSIKGLGPWSVDMFLMFRCHRSNVLPIGDLAVRNGTAALWRTAHAKKDAAAVTELHAPFEPYRSVSSYYMYKVADAMKKTKNKPKSKTTKKPK
jgi:DNA-3-methyladenine glycosylase II